MAKSYKLLGDGNYIDSTGIAHNKVALDQVLTDLANADISAIDNLTSEDTENALSANQGKVLAEQITNAATAVILYDTDSDETKYTKIMSAIAVTKDSSNYDVVTIIKPLYCEIDSGNVDNTKYYFECVAAAGMGASATGQYVLTFVYQNYSKEGYLTITANTSTSAITETIATYRDKGNIEDVLTSTSTTNSLSANQGRALKVLIDALTTRVTALEAGEIELATDPDDTDEMNVWIQTS